MTAYTKRILGINFIATGAVMATQGVFVRPVSQRMLLEMFLTAALFCNTIGFMIAAVLPRLGPRVSHLRKPVKWLAVVAVLCGINAVGCGIKPSSLVEDAALKDQIQRLWLAWTDEADADGLTDFYGLQAMAARAMFEAGECFVRLRPRRPEDGLTVPLQLQMLASEHLQLAKNETLPNGHEVILGIEFDRLGRRVAYHFHRTHPGDVRQSGVGETVRVPAAQVCHVFHPLAEGQLRGVPWVAPAMVRLWLLDQYDDAELDRKQVAAMFAASPSSVITDMRAGAP